MKLLSWSPCVNLFTLSDKYKYVFYFKLLMAKSVGGLAYIRYTSKNDLRRD